MEVNNNINNVQDIEKKFIIIEKDITLFLSTFSIIIPIYEINKRTSN